MLCDSWVDPRLQPRKQKCVQGGSWFCSAHCFVHVHATLWDVRDASENRFLESIGKFFSSVWCGQGRKENWKRFANGGFWGLLWWSLGTTVTLTQQAWDSSTHPAPVQSHCSGASISLLFLEPACPQAHEKASNQASHFFTGYLFFKQICFKISTIKKRV